MRVEIDGKKVLQVAVFDAVLMLIGALQLGFGVGALVTLILTGR
jgi:hypothetical protein